MKTLPSLTVTESDPSSALRGILVYSMAEWRIVGLTEARFRSLARSGVLVRVRHGVYATRAAVEWGRSSPRRGHALRAEAARAAVGRDSVISHQSAAMIHGLDLFPHAPEAVILTRPTAQAG